jgi:hypothetical protein
MTMQRNYFYRLILIVFICCFASQTLMAQEEGTTIRLMLTDPATGENSEFKVFNFGFTVNRSEDYNNTGNNPPFLRAEATLMLSMEVGKQVLQWAADLNKAMNGKVVATDKNGKVVREIAFTNSYVRTLAGSISGGASDVYTEVYLLLGQEITIDGVPMKLKKS